MESTLKYDRFLQGSSEERIRVLPMHGPVRVYNIMPSASLSLVIALYIGLLM